MCTFILTQSEILMFIRSAEAYHFEVTFTHIIEGYSRTAAHGAGIDFADWCWACPV